MSAPRDPFIAKGTGCWCPGEWSLARLRLEGHSEECTRGRRAWEANYRHMSAIDQQKRVDQEIGRQIREAAQDALSKCASGGEA